MEGGEAAERQLKFIDKNRGRIITSDQVRMEYMKHRQHIIIDTINKIKAPEGAIRQLPPILVDAKPAAQIKKQIKSIATQQKRIKARIEKILVSPVYYDQVYQCSQRLFKTKSPFNLTREMDLRLEIRELAKKRFMLGYPPRKNSDNSIGDAVNWEWIIKCAEKSGDDVLVVSRDGDYGPSYQNTAYINDWLSQEFKKRTKSTQRIQLTNRLTDAMKIANFTVSKADEESENKLISNWSPSARDPYETKIRNLFSHGEIDRSELTRLLDEFQQAGT